MYVCMYACMCMQNCTEICRAVKEHSSETPPELYINWSALVPASFCSVLYSEIILIILHWLQSHLFILLIKKADFNTGMLQDLFFLLRERLIFCCFSQLTTLQAWTRIWSGDVNEAVILIQFCLHSNKNKQNVVSW